MPESVKNPYVGPRAFEEEDSPHFFGRKEESDKLTSLAISHRVVLFYAPSGAGKTSLIKAAVIPSLRESADAYSDTEFFGAPVALKAIKQYINIAVVHPMQGIANSIFQNRGKQNLFSC